jgi:hypothetical protein
MNQDSFTREGFATMEKRLVSSGVRNAKGGTLRKAGDLRQWKDSCLVAGGEFGVRTGGGSRRVNAVADFETARARSEFFNDTSGIRTWGVGELNWNVAAVADVCIDRVNADGLNSDQYMALGRFGDGDFDELQNFRPTMRLHSDRFHGEFLRG